MVESGREYLEKELAGLGVETVPTATNFILVNLKRDAGIIYEKLLRRGVIVRPMHVWGLPAFIRVTIGREPENQRFIKALKETIVS